MDSNPDLSHLTTRTLRLHGRLRCALDEFLATNTRNTVQGSVGPWHLRLERNVADGPIDRFSRYRSGTYDYKLWGREAPTAPTSNGGLTLSPE